MSTPLSSEAHADAEGLCLGIARKLTAQQRGLVTSAPASLAIRYTKSFHHPWPRAVDLFAEVMAPSLPEAVRLREALLTHPGEPHLASVFGVETDRDGAAIEAAGYDGCWTSAVMARPLTQDPTSTNVTFERIERAAQIDEINAATPAFPIYASELAEPALASFLARDASGAIVATGGVVIGLCDRAYVYDMWTAEPARGRGIGRAMLATLHTAALEAGATRAVLLPSLMAVETKFYVNCGCQLSSRMGVLLSKEG